jgi:hypothetical protein
MELEPISEAVPQPQPISPELIEYLAGFFDVSGSVTIEKNPARKPQGTGSFNYVLRAELQRVSPEPRAIFNASFPGYGGDRAIPSGKITKRWYIKAVRARAFFEHVGPSLRLKAGHWEKVQQFIETSGNRPPEDSIRLKESIMALNKLPKPSFNKPFSEPYLAGVFDGRGWIDIELIDNHLILKAKVANDHQEFMEEIGRALKTKPYPYAHTGRATIYHVALHSAEAANFLRKVQPFSLRYKELIPQALSFQSLWERNKHKVRSAEEMEILVAARASLLQARGYKVRNAFS